MFKNIPENTRMLASSVMPLVVVLILFLFVGNFGISKIGDIRSQIDQASKTQNLLTQKLNVLEGLTTTLGKAPDIVTNALPTGNSALITISQLRFLASINSVMLSSIKAGAEVKDPSGLSRSDISFEVTGPRAGVEAFLKATATTSPINVVGSVKLTESAGSTIGTITIKSFWAPLPTTLPAVTQALTDLTQSERNILNSVSSLTQPSFVVLPPAAGAGKSDPFSP